MTTPTTETISDADILDPDEPGIDEDEARRRRIVRNQPLIALLDKWIAEAENMTDEERRQAQEDWEEFARGIDEHRLPGFKLYS